MKKLIIALTAVAAMGAPAAASASNSTQCSYAPQTCQLTSIVHHTNTTSATTTGTLPFTGLDVGFLAGGGLLLTATGFGLRRFSAPRKPADTVHLHSVDDNDTE
jgi:hypothetical protein